MSEAHELLVKLHNMVAKDEDATDEEAEQFYDELHAYLAKNGLTGCDCYVQH